MLKLGSSELQIIQVVLELINFFSSLVKFSHSSLLTSIISVEASLFDLIGESFQSLFELGDGGLVLLSLIVDHWRNLLLGLLGDLLESVPFVEEFLDLLDFLVLANTILTEIGQGLLQLIQVEGDWLSLVLHVLDTVLHGNQGLDIRQVLV